MATSPATITQLRNSVLTELQTRLSSILPADTVYESRYVPRDEARELEVLHVVCFILEGSTTITGRAFDQDEYSIGVALQQTVPSGGDDLAFNDEMVARVEAAKSLWRAGDEETPGPLRDATLAGCQFTGLEQYEPFEPLHLMNHGVFTSFFEVKYKAEEA